MTGYEPLISSLIIPDENDRHVLAAAITAGAPVIVTFNLKDFPNPILIEHGVRAVHADDFAISLYDADRETLVPLAKTHRRSLTNPLKSSEDYLKTLTGCGLKKTALRLQSDLVQI